MNDPAGVCQRRSRPVLIDPHQRRVPRERTLHVEQGAVVGEIVAAHPDTEWFERVGARRVFSGQMFSRPTASSVPFEIAVARGDQRANLYRVALPQ